MQECFGFKRNSRKTICHGIPVATVGGLVWVLAVFAPCKAAQLLHPCALQQAEYVLVKVVLLISSLVAVAHCHDTTAFGTEHGRNFLNTYRKQCCSFIGAASFAYVQHLRLLS